MTDSRDLVIVKLDTAKHALAEAKTIQQCTTIVAIAGAMEIYAKRQQLGKDSIAYAYAIKFEALRQLGGLLKETPKNKGLKGSIVTSSKQEPVRDQTPTLADLGINKKTSMLAQQLAGLPQALFEQVRDGTMTFAKALQDTRRAKTNTVAWSLDSTEQDLRLALSHAIVDAPPGSHPLIVDLLRRLAEELEEADRPEVRDAVSIARDELDVRDAEPGGYKIFEGATVTASCKSTYTPWVKELTTAKDGVTALKRRQIEARLTDIGKGKLPTKRTAHTHFAVLLAIKDLPRTSPLGRGVRCATTI